MRATLLLSFAVLAFIPGEVWPQGNPLGSEFRINTYTPHDQIEASIAADSAGNFVVIWETDIEGGFERNIFGQRFASSGTPLGGEFKVDTDEFGGSNRAPSVAADSAGNFVVIWESAPLGAGGLIGRRYASSGAPLAEFNVGNAAYNFHPAAASRPGRQLPRRLGRHFARGRIR